MIVWRAFIQLCDHFPHRRSAIDTAIDESLDTAPFHQDALHQPLVLSSLRTDLHGPLVQNGVFFNTKLVLVCAFFHHC